MAVLLSVVGASSSFIVRSATLFIKTAHKRYDWLKSTNLYSNLLSARHSCSTARSAPTRSPSSYHTRIRRKRTLRCAAPLRLDLCNICRLAKYYISPSALDTTSAYYAIACSRSRDCRFE
ncbi:hypothetical protein PF005_g30222 [Phytophthora fragariae]|uniref:Uncharacterized protein n=1 Tax=Phytophthora fragariae TaxID=53985 RepID=A0A6A3VMU9_9STRA|nr:hypothetical protein PF003_g13771 [Phytophthora fragariae]KAE8919160.1 hypothetical protein PF009_g30527 [Phytophthora fragariae]KAE8961579.1 hypothetical protein PF011_g29698 [Phytophthora fragariae]KAE9060536.1 hypothetical protein PF010_g30180 [Phytophthora fragariae]KAE9066092.1 hypothetical protein PF007_g28610 [Phytophthora fragariae]